MNLLFIVLLLFAVRLASVFIVQTYYVPDEYWQSLEVAHKLTFGYGYLTWEWVQGIRSYVYPVIIAGVYKVLAILNLDTAYLLVLLPRILQACLSAYADYRFVVWSGKKKWALFLTVIPWFSFYIGSRTLANTLEASLTTIALSYFPWRGEGTAYLWPAALCCFLRPTAAIIWLPLCVYHLRKTQMPVVDLIAKRFLLIGLIVGGLCVSLDSFWHGAFIVTPYEFLKYNVFQNVGSFYGSHPWHWYFTVGLPTVLGITTIPFIFGVMETIRNRHALKERNCLLLTLLLSLLVLSGVEHKEFRFVASLLPICLYITADTLTRWSYRASSLMLWCTAIVIVLGNVIPAWYLGTIHQRAPLEVMPKLQQIARDYRDEHNHRASVLFLMPCHSTPYYSHIHENVTMRFLSCEPNLQQVAHYKDEADQFYDSPVHWLRSHVPSYPRTAMPSHVVLFEPLAKHIDEFLVNYKEVVRTSNPELNKRGAPHFLLNWWSAYFEDLQQHVQTLLQHLQQRTGNNVVVYQRLRTGEENTFNRAEYAPDDHDHERDDDVQATPIGETSNAGSGHEHNLFN